MTFSLVRAVPGQLGGWYPEVKRFLKLQFHGFAAFQDHEFPRVNSSRRKGEENGLLQNVPYALRRHGDNRRETSAKHTAVWLGPRLHAPVVPALCQHVTGAHHKGQCSKCNWEAGGDSLDSVTHSSQGALVHLLESEVIFFFYIFFIFNSVGLREI